MFDSINNNIDRETHVEIKKALEGNYVYDYLIFASQEHKPSIDNSAYWENKIIDIFLDNYSSLRTFHESTTHNLSNETAKNMITYKAMENAIGDIIKEKEEYYSKHYAALRIL